MVKFWVYNVLTKELWKLWILASCGQNFDYLTQGVGQNNRALCLQTWDNTARFL